MSVTTTPSDHLRTGPRAISLSERPDLRTGILDMPASWPAYIPADPIVVHWAFHTHPDFQNAVVDDEQVVARAATVPLQWDGDPTSLPDTGWDEALRMSMNATAAGADLNTLCALEIAVAPGRRAQNLSARTLAWLADRARAAGFRDIVVPVRPSHKHHEPWLPMGDYIARRRPDGLPEDPWLRVHARAGAEIVKVCPASMTVSGSLAQWRSWTGLAFDTDGPVVVDGAHAPEPVNTAANHAV